MTTTDEHKEDVALALAIPDEDIPSEVFTDKGGRQRWENQGVLLVTYAKTGNATAGCLAADVTFRTHDRWLEGNVFGYRERFRLAHRVYRDSLEGIVSARLQNPQGNRGGDILLIAKLNAEDPDKWRGNTTTLELSDEMRDFMQRRQAEDATARAALPESKGIVVDPDGALLNDAPPPWETE